jgi:hypothetical protein
MTKPDDKPAKNAEAPSAAPLPEPTCKPTPSNPLELHALRNKGAHGFECLDTLERERAALSVEGRTALDGLRSRFRECLLLCGLPYTDLPS